MSARVEALLFDLGGVLVDVDWQRAFDFWSARSGVPAGDIARRFRRDEAYEAHERGTLPDAGFFAHLRASLGIALPDADMLAGWNAILGEPFPGVPALLRRAAARLPVYVFSNTNVAHVAHFRPRYRELFAPVREVLCSCELGCRKPEREAFGRVAEKIGIAPARILFIDDLEENAAGARAAGLQSAHLASPAQLATIVGDATGSS